MDKQAILEVLIAQQKLSVEELRRSIESYKDSSDLDEDSTLDPEDFSQQSAAKEDQLRLEQQLNKSQINLDLLERYASEKFDIAQVGALIKTDKQWFLLGISITSITSDNNTILCVSMDSPAYDRIVGKKAGDKFILGNHTYKIEEIN